MGSVANLSPVLSSIFSPSPTSCTRLQRDSTSVISDLQGPNQNSRSPSSIEVSSEIVRTENGLETTTEFTGSSKAEVSQVLRTLEEQLSLDDDSIKDIFYFGDKEGAKHNPELFDYGKQSSENEQSVNLLLRPEYNGSSQGYVGHAGMQQTDNLVHLWDAGLLLCHSYEHNSFKCILSMCYMYLSSILVVYSNRMLLICYSRYGKQF